MTETTIKKEKISNNSDAAEQDRQREQKLAKSLELISLLKETPDILSRHPELLAILEVPHETGKAVSLIERQVGVLRKQLKTEEDRLRNLMGVARDNERLANIRHRLTLNLFAAEDLEEVINTILDVLGNELAADFAVIRLITENDELVAQSPELFVKTGEEGLSAFKTMLQQKNTVCGKGTDEQKSFMFGGNADSVNSTAIIPLVSGANLGLIALGSAMSSRFHSRMGTEFLTQMGELISASIVAQLKAAN